MMQGEWMMEGENPPVRLVGYEKDELVARFAPEG